MSTIASNNAVLGGHCAVALGLEHARTIAKHGWTRNDIKNYLWMHSRQPLRRALARPPLRPGLQPQPAEWYKREPDSRIPIVPSPDTSTFRGRRPRRALFRLHSRLGTYEHAGAPSRRRRRRYPDTDCADGAAALTRGGSHAPRHMSRTVLLFDPRGRRGCRRHAARRRARRACGLRLGILDNSQVERQQAAARGASAALGEDIKFAAVNYYVKHSFSKDAAPELIDRIAARKRPRADRHRRLWLLLLLLHPGSARAGKAGMPAAAIITTEFVRETELTRARPRHAGLRRL